MPSLEHGKSAIAIRVPSTSDAVALSPLVAQLGYPASPEELAERIERLAAIDSVVAMVALLDERVVGLVTAHLITSIHSSTPVAWLTALVVAEEARGRGIGAELVHRAEEWARRRGARRIAVTSALHRSGAHEFYDRLGYARTGLRFGRSLVG